jgi:hypothetical protein
MLRHNLTIFLRGTVNRSPDNGGFTVFAFVSCIWWAGTAQPVQRLATVWTVQGSNTGGGEIFLTRPDRPWGPPNLLYNVYQVFPGVKAAGVWR